MKRETAAATDVKPSFRDHVHWLPLLRDKATLDEVVRLWHSGALSLLKRETSPEVSWETLCDLTDLFRNASRVAGIYSERLGRFRAAVVQAALILGLLGDASPVGHAPTPAEALRALELAYHGAWLFLDDLESWLVRSRRKRETVEARALRLDEEARKRLGGERTYKEVYAYIVKNLLKPGEEPPDPKTFPDYVRRARRARDG
jgi:hypothetical protein